MWNISMLKENAKSCLKGFYWTAVLASLIFIVLTGAGRSSNAGRAASTVNSGDIYEQYFGDHDYYHDYGYDYDHDHDHDYGYGYDHYDDHYDDYDDSYDTEEAIEEIREMFSDIFEGDTMDRIIQIIAVIFIIALLIAAASEIFFKAPLRAGYNRFFLDGRTGGGTLDKLFYSFGGGRYLKTVKLMFLYDLRLFVWQIPSLVCLLAAIGSIFGVLISMIASGFSFSSLYRATGMFFIFNLLYLILLIPYYIKYFDYLLVPYIAAENPDTDIKRALDISRQTMQGEKMHCLGLTLSFIGWFILGGVAGSILSLFSVGIFGTAAAVAGMALVYPYFYATRTEFYCCMKEKAFAMGIARRDELDGFSGAVSNGVPFPDQSVYNSAGYGQPPANGGYSSFDRTGGSVNSSGSYPAYGSSENNAPIQDGGLFGESNSAVPPPDAADAGKPPIDLDDPADLDSGYYRGKDGTE